MAFRADELKKDGYESALRFLIPRGYTGQDRERSRAAVEEIADACGPVIDTYPSWHPFLVAKNEHRWTPTVPHADCGYLGLDHTVFFAHGFVTCPYGDGQKVIDSVNKLPPHPVASFTAERLDAKLYNPDASPVLVRCHWSKSLTIDGMVPKSVAIPLLLEQEVPCWRWAQVAETWKNMLPYFLGRPHGSRSSLFVDQETGQAMKNIWNALINTGMYGPIKVD